VVANTGWQGWSTRAPRKETRCLFGAPALGEEPGRAVGPALFMLSLIVSTDLNPFEKKNDGGYTAKNYSVS
jgi:hypothetical protein